MLLSSTSVLFFSTSSSTKKNSIAENVSHRCSSTRARSTPSAAAAAAAAAQSSPPAFFLSVFYRFISVFLYLYAIQSHGQTDRQTEKVCCAVNLLERDARAASEFSLSPRQILSLQTAKVSSLGRSLSHSDQNALCDMRPGKKAAPRERSTKKVKKKRREKNSTLRLTTTHATNQPDTKDEGHIGLFCLSEIFLYI